MSHAGVNSLCGYWTDAHFFWRSILSRELSLHSFKASSQHIWTELQFANSSVNGHTGIHVSRTNRALTVLVSLQRDQRTRRITGSTRSDQFSLCKIKCAEECRPWARRWINHWSLWRMAKCDSRPTVTFRAAVPHRPSTAGSNHTAWWQRHMCVNNLPKVVSWKRNDRELNPRPSEPQVHRAKHYACTRPQFTSCEQAFSVRLWWGISV